MAFVRLMTLRQGSLSSSWQKASNAWALSLLVYASVLLLSVPTIISHQIQEFPRDWWYSTCRTGLPRLVYANLSNYSVYTIDTSSLALQNGCRLYKANLWLSGIMFKFVPCVFLAILSTSLLLRISAAEKNRRRLLGAASNLAAASKSSGGANSGRAGGGGGRRRRTVDNTTIMLITILLLFLVTELPQGAVAILNAAFLSHLTTNIYHNVADFLDLLSLINSSVKLRALLRHVLALPTNILEGLRLRLTTHYR